MNEFTFEKNEKTIYETCEWDKTWIDRTKDKETKRVLYIGDSISCATRTVATELSGYSIIFDGFGTSKGLDNPFYKPSLKAFAIQEPRRDAIIFNNGLHGWHLEDTTSYLEHYDSMIAFLIEEFPDTPIYIALTTAITDPWDCRVKIRNESAKKVAEKYGLTVIDLYSPTDANRHLITPDKIHLTEQGYELVAKTILDTIK